MVKDWWFPAAGFALQAIKVGYDIWKDRRSPGPRPPRRIDFRSKQRPPADQPEGRDDEAA